LQGAEILFEIAKEFPDLSFVDFGSGFKVAYKEGDITTDIEELGSAISQRFQEFCKEYGRELELWFEPGKFLVSECGYLITQVNVVKPTPEICFVQTNSGFNHLIRPMFYDAFHRIENISNPHGEHKIYTITGNICETDTFATDRALPEINESDYLVFFNAGAYGFEMSSNFNSRYKPAEVLVNEDEVKLIRRRDTFDDLLTNQIPL
jgi:diaminopimelate decarboxylase